MIHSVIIYLTIHSVGVRAGNSKLPLGRCENYKAKRGELIISPLNKEEKYVKQTQMQLESGSVSELNVAVRLN